MNIGTAFSFFSFTVFRFSSLLSYITIFFIEICFGVSPCMKLAASIYRFRFTPALICLLGPIKIPELRWAWGCPGFECNREPI